jgi:hypothetical protein
MLTNFTILIFSGADWFPSRLIEWLTWCKYSHVAMLLEDPIYIQQSLRGKYMLESGEEPTPNVVTGKKKLGTQLQWWDWILLSYPGRVYARSFRWLVPVKSAHLDKQLAQAWNDTRTASYDLDLIDFLEAELHTVLRDKGQITREFICSAYITFILTRMGALPEKTPWDTFSPNDFADTGRIDSHLRAHGKAVLGPLVQLK